MSAEVLREAAKAIREEWTGNFGTAWHREQAFHLAVARWLAAEAEAHIHFPGSDITRAIYDMPGMTTTPALAAAHAYLGTTPTEEGTT